MGICNFMLIHRRSQLALAVIFHCATVRYMNTSSKDQGPCNDQVEYSRHVSMKM